MSINLKDTTYLLNNGFIMVTKKGTAWRCGKGYRKDWSKLIGKEVLLHNKPYILTNRVKKNSKWYLVYTDGTNSYTELQTKALHNKGMAKDTIIEAVKRVIAGLLTAPKELIDTLLEEANYYITNYKQQQLNDPANYTKKGTLRKNVIIKRTWKEFTQRANPRWLNKPVNLYRKKAQFIDIACRLGWKQPKKVYRQLIQYYHPDHNPGFPTECLQAFNWLNH